MKSVITVFVTIIAVAAVAVAGALVFAWSGAYDVAADKPDFKIISWYVKHVRERSIEIRSRNVTPVSSVNPDLVQKINYYYYGTCNICHGSEGNPSDKFTRGMDPVPPEFASAEWDPPTKREMFWIIKNGIKMTAMASFGKDVFKDDEIWTMVDFLEKFHNKVENKGSSSKR